VIKIHVSKKIELIQATYFQEQQVYAILDNNGKLIISDRMGNTKCFTHIDQNDKVVLMEARNQELWVGTIEGVLRVYTVKDDSINLTQIFGCFFNELSEVTSYFLVGETKVEKIVFSIHRSLF
jgi:hypothetical protein